jgi:glycosyltransferase involved in cell wall biosynthesis
VNVVARGLAALGHTVHVVCPDLTRMERRGDSLFYWGEAAHPTHADVVVAAHSLDAVGPDAVYHAPVLVLMSNGIGAHLGPGDDWTRYLDAVACFSECHIDLLTRAHPSIPREKCHVTGLGVDLADYPVNHGLHVPGRMLYSNDPVRGLWHTLDIFERVQADYPEASLHVGYDFERRFAGLRWEASWRGQMLWECRHRMHTLPNVVDLGSMTREQTIRAECETHVGVMASDPPNVGSQIHGLLQCELAAAGVPLVLSDTEAFREVFGSAAEILPLPGTFLVDHERRFDPQDWSEVILHLMQDEAAWAVASQASRALAETLTWNTVVTNWATMLDALSGPTPVALEAA